MNAYSYQFEDHEVTATFTQRAVIRDTRKGVSRKHTRKVVRS